MRCSEWTQIKAVQDSKNRLWSNQYGIRHKSIESISLSVNFAW